MDTFPYLKGNFSIPKHTNNIYYQNTDVCALPAIYRAIWFTLYDVNSPLVALLMYIPKPAIVIGIEHHAIIRIMKKVRDSVSEESSYDVTTKTNPDDKTKRSSEMCNTDCRNWCSFSATRSPQHDSTTVAFSSTNLDRLSIGGTKNRFVDVSVIIVVFVSMFMLVSNRETNGTAVWSMLSATCGIGSCKVITVGDKGWTALRTFVECPALM